MSPAVVYVSVQRPTPSFFTLKVGLTWPSPSKGLQRTTSVGGGVTGASSMPPKSATTATGFIGRTVVAISGTLTPDVPISCRGPTAGADTRPQGRPRRGPELRSRDRRRPSVARLPHPRRAEGRHDSAVRIPPLA